jgi:hypothetical protein
MTASTGRLLLGLGQGFTICLEYGYGILQTLNSENPKPPPLGLRLLVALNTNLWGAGWQEQGRGEGTKPCINGGTQRKKFQHESGACKITLHPLRSWRWLELLRLFHRASAFDRPTSSHRSGLPALLPAARLRHIGSSSFQGVRTSAAPAS